MNHRLARRILYMFEDDGMLKLTYNGVAKELGTQPEETKDTLDALVAAEKICKYRGFYRRNTEYVHGHSPYKEMPPGHVKGHSIPFSIRRNPKAPE